MSVLGALVVVVALLGASAFGVVRRSRAGRVRASAPQQLNAETLAPDTLGGAPLGERATLVQFSSAFCRPCVATRHVLREVADTAPGVRHVEVDAESHLELVRALGVASTPTTLLVDGSGIVRHRAVGVPRRDEVYAALAALVARR